MNATPPPIPDELKDQITDLDGMSDEQIEARLSALRDRFKMFGTSVEEFSEKMGAFMEQTRKTTEAVGQLGKAQVAPTGHAYNHPTDGGSSTLSDVERKRRRAAAKRQRQARKKNR
ncbi:hypothetical protein SEA_LITTLEFELLA_77 [Gordonia phage LittleFella]|nr:hypothetical protein SEA_LITTLEFELLA_77 [Gordonia phage LittleFella]